MTEIIDSFNGRIFREPPYLWSALSNLSAGLTGADAFPGQVVEEQTAERIQGLKDEAKASMSAVSGFAAALEPYLDQAGEFWWLSQARDDPRCAELLGALRDVVDEFKDVDKYHRKADEKLIGVEEVKELTAEFVAAYPHWETVVERVGGRPSAGSRPAPDPAAVGPRENYSSPLRGGGQAVGRVSGIATWAEPPLSADPIEEPPWQDVLTSSLLLFRRYESGAAEKEDWLAWDERVRRLRSAYEHYAAGVADLPTYVWTTLFRDALFVPRSAPHRAVTELLELGLSAGSPGSEAEIRRIADRFGVDEAVLHQALGRLTSTV
jgi:hypothetical protein